MVLEQYFLSNKETFFKKSKCVLLSCLYQSHSFTIRAFRRLFLKDVKRFYNIDNIKKSADLCMRDVGEQVEV